MGDRPPKTRAGADLCMIELSVRTTGRLEGPVFSVPLDYRRREGRLGVIQGNCCRLGNICCPLRQQTFGLLRKCAITRPLPRLVKRSVQQLSRKWLARAGTCRWAYLGRARRRRPVAAPLLIDNPGRQRPNSVQVSLRAVSRGLPAQACLAPQPAASDPEAGFRDARRECGQVCRAGP